MARRSSRLKQLTLFDDIAPTISAAKAGSSGPSKRPPRRQRKPRIQSSEDESVAGPSVKQAESHIPMAISEDGDEPAESLPRPPTKRRRVQIVDSDSDVESKPTRSRFKTGSKKLAGSEEESTAEDLASERRRVLNRKHSVTSAEDISGEVDEQRILPTRMRSRGKQTAFQKSLERLKLRKQTKIADIVSSDDDQHESDNSIIPFEGAQPSGEIDSQDETSGSNSDTSNFIVEDDDAVPELPIEFSMESHQDLSFQFKKIFQFFVHIAVNSPIDRHDYMKRQMKHEEYFSVPLNTTRRKLLGLRDSLVASSVWSAEFKRTLEKYANFEIVPLDFAIPYCDACHLGGRMSTLIGRVTGPFYDRAGFESIDDAQDSDEEAEEGETKTEFHLGRFCARRTRVYHEFSHWEYHLFQCINEEIEQLRQLPKSKGRSFHRVAYVGGKLPPEDLNDADGLCEWLEERKIIDMEWQKLKTMMESARHLELATKGEGD